MKTCTKCSTPKPDEDFPIYNKSKGYRRGSCFSCTRSYRASWDEVNTDKVRRKARKHTLKQYGLTPSDYDDLLVSQVGLCAICGSKTEGSLHVDHCHTTGEVRGLLCGTCNRGLGMFYDNPDLLRSAASYIEKYA